ncbi:Crp/Fnr family transcriptional regulator [Azospirillum griseum]|uniref:Crp/Fnr family transcriptional regulator n=1 Tax=Azospirillum griseum TaxID=2496639 RepID=A0A3S0KCL5_9PROT|nr:Crp/Fnr family transcriptional regulator [Azospirillum griseum]RTR22369.1 Crp/Fnr family transcriptional regulator [Azospirillum griseum]
MNTSTDVALILRRNRLLEELDAIQMAELLTLGYVGRFSHDQMIFEKGDSGDCLYAVLKGQIAIRTSSADGKTMLLNILNSGDVLGEIGLLDGRERTASAVAIGPTELYRIDRNDFIPFLERHPRLCTRMMIVLCERLRWVSENIEDAVFHDVPRRLARRLLHLADSYGQESPLGVRITQPMSQEALANMLGVTREMVNKSLGALRKSGIVTYAKGFIVINNLSLLKDMAGDAERVP